MRSIRPLMAEHRRLEARRIRYPPVSVVERAYITRRLGEIAAERQRILTQMRHIRTTELPILEETIASERRRFRRKIVVPPPPPPRLHRVKIRIYNEERKPTPTGMFQGFYMICGLIDPETGLVDWDFWLTKDQIRIAKQHMVAYYRGMVKWRTPDELGLAYFDEPRGVPYEEETVVYKRKKKTGEPFAKNVPRDFIARAETLTVSELIVGESSVEPEPIVELKKENMAVFCEEMIIIDAKGVIKWHEILNKYVPATAPTDEEIERLRKELKM